MRLTLILLALYHLFLTGCGHSQIEYGSTGSSLDDSNLDLVTKGWDPVLPKAWLQDPKRPKEFYLATRLIQDNGQIIHVGEFSTKHVVFALKRTNADGTIDTSFGTKGYVTTDVSSGTVRGATNADLQSDGKIVVTGGDFAVARYNPDGTLDMKTKLPIPGNSTAVKALSDGSILVGGGEYDKNYFYLGKIKADGTMDRRFGSAGMVKYEIGAWMSSITSIAVLSDGSIIVGGNSTLPSRQFKYNATFAKLTKKGELDVSFGSKGFVVKDLTSDWNATIGVPNDPPDYSDENHGNGADRVAAVFAQNDDSVLAAIYSNGGGFVESNIGMFSIYHLDTKKGTLTLKKAKKAGEWDDSMHYKLSGQADSGILIEKWKSSFFAYQISNVDVLPPQEPSTPTPPPPSVEKQNELKPCAQISAICRNAGFKVNQGLHQRCLKPLLKGKKVTFKGKKVSADPDLVSKCNAKLQSKELD